MNAALRYSIDKIITTNRNFKIAHAEGCNAGQDDALESVQYLVESIETRDTRWNPVGLTEYQPTEFKIGIKCSEGELFLVGRLNDGLEPITCSVIYNGQTVENLTEGEALNILEFCNLCYFGGQ